MKNTRGPQLRPYQNEAVSTIQSGMTEGRGRVLFALPTGAGKTDIAIRVVGDHLDTHGDSRVVWLTHRRELLRQSLERIQAAGIEAVDVTERRPHQRSLTPGEVTIITPNLARIRDLVETAGGADLLVLDEAHHWAASSWSYRVIGPWPGPVLGVTATPWRMSKREGFDDTFDVLVCGPTIRELIDSGYLSPFTILSPAGLVIKGAGRDSSGDYAPKAIERANATALFSDLPVRVWEDAAVGRRTIWYAPTVLSATTITDQLIDRGHTSAVIDATTPMVQRRERVENFRNGRLQHLVNVAVLTEGFDVPDADCVVILRTTRSKALYLQMVGRALRPQPGKHALVLDLGRSWAEPGVGHPLDDHHWTLAPRGNTVEAAAPEGHCQRCGAANPAAARTCQHCNAALGKICPGCGRFRYAKRWTDMDTNRRCVGCEFGSRATQVTMSTVSPAPPGWSWNPAGTVMWHHSNSACVRVADGAIAVGYRRLYRPTPGYGSSMNRRTAFLKLEWVGGYATVDEATEAVAEYCRNPRRGFPRPRGGRGR